MTPPTTPQDCETIIGLEVHLQFHTATKIFCGCCNAFGDPPNTHVCPVCLGLPGSLPVLNRQALTLAVKVALALQAEVQPVIKFDRKNYTYPDLPKGYQISQYDMPIAHDGRLIVPTGEGEKTVRILRAHLEEDAGKLIHDPEKGCSLVDYNRTGTPLMEIVSQPDLRSPQEAYDYLVALKLLLSYCDVSDCDMEKGSLRCDANISVRRRGESALGTKSEIKNLNSFKAVRQALEYEERRHQQLFLAGEPIVQETRLWNEHKQITVAMRSKEEAHDYRYFPEPDLVPFTLKPEFIDHVRKGLPEFPLEKQKRLQAEHGLSAYDARILVQDPLLADFFEDCVRLFPSAKKIANWIAGPLLSEINTRKVGVGHLSLSAEHFTTLISRVEEGQVSNLAGKEILKVMLDSGENPDTIIKKQGLAQVSDDGALESIIEEVLAQNPAVVEQIQDGKPSAIGFLIGQAMKKSQGKANPKKVGEMLKRRLSV